MSSFIEVNITEKDVNESHIIAGDCGDVRGDGVCYMILCFESNYQTL